MVGAYVFASAVRGLLTAVLIVGVGLVFTSAPVTHPFHLVGFLVVTSVLFAGFGVIGGLWATDFDNLTVMNQFILRPLVFFGAVFYSLEVLPPLWRTVSLLNPMVYMVNGVRYGMIGVTEIDPTVSLAVLTGAAIGVLGVNLVLFKRGFGLTE
jgi:ABC-2 type transport system permease protein